MANLKLNNDEVDWIKCSLKKMAWNEARTITEKEEKMLWGLVDKFDCSSKAHPSINRKAREKADNQEMTTYSATLVKNEITVDADSEDKAKTIAIKRFMELLEEDKVRLSKNSWMIRIDESLDNYD